MVSEAEVCRMNSVTAPSLASMSCTNLATSAVRSTNPARDVCTVRQEVATELGATSDGGLCEIDLDKLMEPRKSWRFRAKWLPARVKKTPQKSKALSKAARHSSTP